ncbi:MAG: Gfo/Idh/MocA family oxidoreductase [Candidatus Bathyarchaeia archaeon]
MIKLGIVGLGKMGLLHLRNAKLICGVKIEAAADASKKRLKIAESLGVRHLFTDYREMLRTDVDAVIIALPNWLHKDAAVEAAEAKKCIFIEKPLARTLEECKVIINAVEKNGVLAMVGHNYRFLDCVEKVKEISDLGVIGEVEIATEEFVMNGPFAPSIYPSPVPEWYFNREKIGMGCLDSGYHLIDLFMHFFGDAELLYAHLDNRYHLPYEDNAILVLKSQKTSTKGVLNVGWFSKMIFPKFNFRMILHGTAGFVSTDQFMPGNMYTHAMKEAAKNILRKILGMKIKPLTYTYYYASLFKEIEAFVNCLKKGCTPPITLYDALRVISLIDRVYKETFPLPQRPPEAGVCISKSI